LNQTELKLALADLQEAGRGEPSVAAMLKTEGPLRDFIAAVLTLSPYLREIVNLDPAPSPSRCQQRRASATSASICGSSGSVMAPARMAGSR
ncbi:hypothetical protein ACC771_16890, partial [Rhizobium ruizarguesonis]